MTPTSSLPTKVPLDLVDSNWESSPLLKWYNSIPKEIVFNKDCMKICKMDRIEIPSFKDVDSVEHLANVKYRKIFKLLKQVIVELIRNYDPSINRHTLKRLKVNSIISIPIYFEDMVPAGGIYGEYFRVCTNQQLEEVLDEQKSEA